MAFLDVAETYAFAADMFDELEKETSGTGGTVDTIEALQGDLGVGLSRDAKDGIEEFRGNVAESLDPETIDLVTDPILRGLAAEVMSLPDAVEGDLDTIWEKVWDHMDSQNYHVKSRDWTFGTPAAGGANVGNGEVVRLTIDEAGYDMEGWFADDYTLTCRGSARTLGEVGQEVFQLEGETLAEDGLKITGSGLDVSFAAMDSRTAQGVVSNPSWDTSTSDADVGSPATPTAISGWTDHTDDDFSNLQIDLDTFYIATPGAAANAGLRFLANKTIKQDLVTANGTSFDFSSPYLFGVALRRELSADGTMTIRLANDVTGGVSRAITITGQSNDTWAWYWLVATPGTNNWPKNFEFNNLTLSFAWTGRTTGEIVLDHIVAGPMTRVGAFGDTRSGRGAMGQYIAVRSGTTPWVRDDVFTWTDSEDATRAVNQYWTARKGRGYFPAWPDATQVTASGGRTLTFADVDPDTITASSGDFDADGYKPGMTLTVAGTSSNNGTYTIATVSATVITLVSGDSLTNEGPLSATATLDGTAPIADK